MNVVLSGRWDLLLPHRDRLLRLVRTRLSDPRDAEDCVQETLLRAAVFPRLDEQRVGGFLTTIALRLCVDHYRAVDCRRRLSLRMSFNEYVASPEDVVCDEAIGIWLLAMASQLPGREREVMLARADGMSTAQAAQRLGISRKAAESAFTRGRARLTTLYRDAMAEISEVVCAGAGACPGDHGCGQHGRGGCHDHQQGARVLAG